jgi:biopolymer transport protein ExbB
MIEVFKGAGLLIYPLGICSVVAAFIICERAYALRQGAVMPRDLVDAIVSGKPLVGGNHSVLARIVDFAQEHSKDEEAVKAFARLEINRMEREAHGCRELPLIRVDCDDHSFYAFVALCGDSGDYGVPLYY